MKEVVAVAPALLWCCFRIQGQHHCGFKGVLTVHQELISSKELYLYPFTFSKYMVTQTAASRNSQHCSPLWQLDSYSEVSGTVFWIFPPQKCPRGCWKTKWTRLDRFKTGLGKRKERKLEVYPLTMLLPENK